MSVAEAVSRLAARHRKEGMRGIEADHCPTCRLPWPCDVAQVLDALGAIAAAAEPWLEDFGPVERYPNGDVSMVQLNHGHTYGEKLPPLVAALRDLE